MQEIKVIGLGAIARVGKDTLAKMLVNLLEKENRYCKIFRLADALKADCEAFLKEKCGLDVWSEDTIEKAQFRDMLVWYGKVKRSQSLGCYWTSIVENSIRRDVEENKPERPVYIVPDIRYCEYQDSDEIFWLKKNMSGFFIYMARITPTGHVIRAANPDEEENSYKIEKFSDYSLLWPELSLSEKEGEPSRHAIDLFKFLKENYL